MTSSFLGIEIAKRGIVVSRRGLDVVSNNISHANDPNYARERVELSDISPLYLPSITRGTAKGLIGQGVKISEIAAIREAFYDDKIISQNSNVSYWKVSKKYINEIERIYNFNEGGSLRELFDEVWKAWEELSNHPESSAHRVVLKEKAMALLKGIRKTFSELYTLKQQIESDIANKIERINNLIGTIAKLNQDIKRVQALNDNPNSLYDQREKLLEKLSELVDISVVRNKNEFMVYIGGEVVIQGDKFTKLEVKQENSIKVYWQGKEISPNIKGGEISALYYAYRITRKHIDWLNAFTINYADRVNEIHQDGFSIANTTGIKFFDFAKITDDVNGNYDSNGDGIYDKTAIFKVAGRNTIDPKAEIGSAGIITLKANDKNETIIQIPYSATDTIKDVIDRINSSKAGVRAYIDHRNRLVLKGRLSQDNPSYNFIIRHIEDSGNLLVGIAGILYQSGPNGAYDWNRTNEIQKLQSIRRDITIAPLSNPASNISLNKEIIQNPNLIASASGIDVGGVGFPNRSKGAGNGEIAQLIAKIRYENSYIEDVPKYQDFFSTIIADIGGKGFSAEIRLKKESKFLKALSDIRQKIMGVNIDEELVKMIQLQHSYQASAKMLNVLNDFLDTIINRLGR